MFQDNETLVHKAIHADLGRGKLDASFTETIPVVTSAVAAADALTDWTKPENPDISSKWYNSWQVTNYKLPKGVAVIVGPWNVPFVTTMAPLIGAIAAGCPCVVKPSEIAPASAQLLTDLFPKYLDSKAYAIVNGGVAETTQLLEFKWDHIFFTGGTGIGRIIAQAAAKQLTPVTLELGGKCPVYVDDNADFKLTAKRVLWGKQFNAGQLCIAPDYVLVSRDKQAEIVQAFKDVYNTFWPAGAMDSDSEYAKIVSPTHHHRLKSLIGRTSGVIVEGGKWDESKIEPTIVKDVSVNDALMEEEIFGPIIPLLPVDSLEDALRIINSRPTPLAVYVFTYDPAVKEKFLHESRSGSLIFNDTVEQSVVTEVPFGGLGNSGYGNYGGKRSFDTFTHVRGSVDVPKEAEPFLQPRYPPFSEEAFQVFSVAQIPIPKD